MAADVVCQIATAAQRRPPQPWAVPQHLSSVNYRIAITWLWDVILKEGGPGNDPRAGFLAVCLLTKHFMLRSEPVERIQLVIVAAILIGEKVYWPQTHSVSDMNDLTDFTFTNAAIIAMERQLLIEHDHWVTGDVLPDLCGPDVPLALQIQATKHPELLHYPTTDIADALWDRVHHCTPPSYPDCYHALTRFIPE